MVDRDPHGVQRRVAGHHDFRMDGMRDLLWRAEGTSVFDIGCNRGMVCKDFSDHGARLVHGCDIYEKGIETAREVFADIRSVESQFEVVDLRQGAAALKAFGERRYDIVVMLATYHKLKREMTPEALADLVKHFGRRTNSYFAWRATSDKPDENEQEKVNLDRDLGECRMRCVHLSYMSNSLGMAAVWAKV